MTISVQFWPEEPPLLLDEEDADLLDHPVYWWRLGGGYIRRWYLPADRPPGAPPYEYLHRTIAERMGIIPKVGRIQVRFKNRNRFDCRRENLYCIGYKQPEPPKPINEALIHGFDI